VREKKGASSHPKGSLMISGRSLSGAVLHLTGRMRKGIRNDSVEVEAKEAVDDGHC